MAKLSENYFAVPPGEIYPVWFSAGTEVSGELEEMAKRDGKIAPKGMKRSGKAHLQAPESK
jgi:hypothetical protein